MTDTSNSNNIVIPAKAGIQKDGDSRFRGNDTLIKRILIVRTDKMGDVILSTPVITAVRTAFPDAYIAMMSADETKDIVSGNPYLNEVIVYDKNKKHKSFFKTLCFALRLRSKKFDLALILHSTNRTNIVCCIAGIPRRVGYARGKMDGLLTDKLEYKKRLGEKHESEYCLDVLRSIGVEARMSPLIVPVQEGEKETLDNLLEESGIPKTGKFAIISPAAGCFSRIWPAENFAKTADILIEEFKIKVVLISSPAQAYICEKVGGLMRNKPLFLCGRLSIGELAALINRAELLVSNDSGPVHIAAAVGTPVISIFSRNEKGLSPVRWRPLGDKSVVLHKDVGCRECPAHNCKKGFLCLKSITAEDVIDEARKILYSGKI